MKTTQSRLVVLFLTLIVGGCKVTVEETPRILDVIYVETSTYHPNWLLVTHATLGFYGYGYSLYDLQEHYASDYADYPPSLADLSWFMWDLSGVDSGVTGVLTYDELCDRIDLGHPVWLNYGDYEGGHLVIVYGYDTWGRLYIHEPDYGVRVLDYDDLHYRRFGGTGYYWEYSLILAP